uniref:Uncharacterized protein n=1 Tax=Romanomermis culicivorax TaxID=13658 RepID=A0A915L351_ROMCU
MQNLDKKLKKCKILTQKSEKRAKLMKNCIICWTICKKNYKMQNFDKKQGNVENFLKKVVIILKQKTCKK